MLINCWGLHAKCVAHLYYANCKLQRLTPRSRLLNVIASQRCKGRAGEPTGDCASGCRPRSAPPSAAGGWPGKGGVVVVVMGGGGGGGGGGDDGVER